MRKVAVSEYDEAWGEMFRSEAEKLSKVFGDNLVAIHHIGSTSVPGLKAKPVIDIMPVVKDITVVDNLNLQMEALGYQPQGENGIVGRRFFQKGGDDRTHHVHVFEVNHETEIQRHLAFRDYLRSHPAEARRHGDVKAELARKFPTDIGSYMDGKNSLVKEIEHRALIWREKSEQN